MEDAAPDGGLGPDAEGRWSVAGPGTRPAPGPAAERPGRRHQDLWVFGGGAIVTAAAMAVAFAAASGAVAAGHGQAPRPAATQTAAAHSPGCAPVPPATPGR